MTRLQSFGHRSLGHAVKDFTAEAQSTRRFYFKLPLRASTMKILVHRTDRRIRAVRDNLR
jgi:hypothetical protein